MALVRNGKGWGWAALVFSALPVGLATVALSGVGCAKRPSCELTSSVFLGPRVAGEKPDVSSRPELEERLAESGRQLRADLRICIDDTGAVREVSLLSGTGDWAFDEMVVGKAKDWKYCPAHPPRREVICEDVALRWPRVAAVRDTYATPTRPSDTPRIVELPVRPGEHRPSP
jgi:hypothetical protein